MAGVPVGGPLNHQKRGYQLQRTSDSFGETLSQGGVHTSPLDHGQTGTVYALEERSLCVGKGAKRQATDLRFFGEAQICLQKNVDRSTLLHVC